MVLWFQIEKSLYLQPPRTRLVKCCAVCPSVPCVPTEVAVSHNCEGNLANVMWAPTPGAQHYRAIARSNGGAHSECVSSGTACNFNDLQCGRVYTVGVVALSGYCTSLESKNAVLQTGMVLL